MLMFDLRFLKYEFSITMSFSVAFETSTPVLMPWMLARRIVTSRFL